MMFRLENGKLFMGTQVSTFRKNPKEHSHRGTHCIVHFPREPVQADAHGLKNWFGPQRSGSVRITEKSFIKKLLKGLTRSHRKACISNFNKIKKITAKNASRISPAVTTMIIMKKFMQVEFILNIFTRMIFLEWKSLIKTTKFVHWLLFISTFISRAFSGKCF